MKRTYTQGDKAYEDMSYYSLLGYPVKLVSGVKSGTVGYILEWLPFSVEDLQ